MQNSKYARVNITYFLHLFPILNKQPIVVSNYIKKKEQRHTDVSSLARTSEPGSKLINNYY